MIEPQYIIDTIEDMPQILYNRNKEISMNLNNTKHYAIYDTPEYVYLEEILDQFFPYNLNIYLPDLLVPVNLNYIHTKTELLATHILNNGVEVFV